jgi:hypothetical protein
MPGEVLHVLERHASVELIGDRLRPKLMRRQTLRQPGVLNSPLDPLADDVMVLADNSHVRPFDAWNNGVSFASPAILATLRYASIKLSRSCRTRIPQLLQPFS